MYFFQPLYIYIYICIRIHTHNEEAAPRAAGEMPVGHPGPGLGPYDGVLYRQKHIYIYIYIHSMIYYDIIN